MNGFVKSALVVLLDWIRRLITNAWKLLRSDDGSVFMRFLGRHWLGIVIAVCAVCIVVDGIVFFFRWRPDLVWATQLRRLRLKRTRRERKPVEKPVKVKQPKPKPVPEPEPYPSFAPLQQAYANAPAVPAAQLWQQAQAQPQPVWDDNALWEDDDVWQDQPTVSYTRPQTPPASYYRDVQAGFAPALPPEQLYTPSATYQQPEPEPVHPGLDEEAFLQNIGLQPAPAPQTPVAAPPVFRPFTVTQEPKPEAAPQGALQRLAQKARGFIALDEEQRSIRDLQSNVDVSKAFHEPVYPQTFDQTEE